MKIVNTVKRNFYFKIIKETVTNDNFSKRDLVQLLKKSVRMFSKELKQNKRKLHYSNSI